MEGAIQTMVKVFLKSSKGKGSLGKKEFHGLVKSQLSNILSDTDSKEAINNMSQGLDSNQDGKVGFEEFMKLVGYLATSLSEQREANPDQTALTINDKPNGERVLEGKSETVEVTKAEGAVEANAGGVPLKVEANAGGFPLKVEANAGGFPLKVDANAGGLPLKVDVKAEGQTAKEEPAGAKVSLSGGLAEVPAVPAVLKVAAPEVPKVAVPEVPVKVEVAAAEDPAVLEVKLPGAVELTTAGELPAAADTLATNVEAAVKEAVTVETEKMEEAVNEAVAAVEEELEKKVEEATS